MTIKYVGPKPIISHCGVSFDNNKQDKFVYLGIVVQLINALDHEYIQNKSYEYEEKSEISQSEILNVLRKYCPNLDDLLDKTNDDVEHETQENIQRAHNSDTLSSEDKEALINNINIMHDYTLQRLVNKSVYYCALRALADIVQRDHIDHITIPMSEPFLHVLHSLQGTLLNEKTPIDTKLDIFQKDKELFVTLKVTNISKK